MDLENISQQGAEGFKQAGGAKKKKKNSGKAVPLNFNDEDSPSTNQDELAEQHRQSYSTGSQVRARPDLRAKIDDLFDQYIKLDKELEKSQKSLDYYFNSYSHYGIHEEMLQD